MNIKTAISLTDTTTYALSLGGITIPGCKVAVDSGTGPVAAANLSINYPNDTSAVISGETEAGKIAVTFSAESNPCGESVSVIAELDLGAGTRRVTLFPLFGATLEKATHLLSHGRTMGGCKTCKLPATSLVPDDDETETGKFSSSFQTMVSFADRKLHVTHPLRQDNLSTVIGEIDGDFVRDFGIQTVFEFPKAGHLVSEKATLSSVEDGFAAMLNWGKAQQTQPLPAEPQPVGWNSWDYYRWTITEDEVMKNAEFIAADPVLSKHVKRIIVDDGWQYCYGEWEPNPFFKSGMDTLAKNLRKLGFTPGLWICPGIAEPHSMIAQWQTDWLAMSEGGDPCLSFDCMRRKGFVIDPTLPEVKQWLFNLFTKYADMGYGYFKTDFLIPVCRAPRYHREVPRGQIIRELMTPITDAIRGKAELLGCGYDYTGGCDLVRMVRAGGDIHASWGSVRANAVSLAARFWASNTVWVTDPDFCVCRGPETSADPDIGRLRCLYVFVKPEETARGFAPDRPWSYGFDSILAHEAQGLLSLALMNGGAVNLSDKLYVLNGLGLDLLRRTVSAPRGSAPVPVDLFETDLASKWIQKVPGGYRVLIINWQDTDAEVSFDLAPFGINATKGKNFWTDEDVAISGNVLRATLRAHGCLMVTL